MTRRSDKPLDSAARRALAEARLREQHDVKTERAEGDPLTLLHELQVHQIELEMQNEELMVSRAELEHALDRYEKLYELAPIGYVTLAEDGSIRAANIMSASILAVQRREDLIGKRLSAFLTDEDLRGFNAALSAALHDGQSGRFEVTLRSGKGASARPPVLEIAIGAAEQNENECRVAMFDVTSRKEAEEQLRAFRKMEAIGRLAGGVAHDFNNLVTVILTYNSFALEHAKQDAALTDDLLQIEAAAGRAAALTSQLLSFGRKQHLTLRIVDVNDVVRRTATLLRRVLEPNLSLELRLADGLWHIEVDAARFEEALMNLAINARDAMPEGGRICISTENREIDPSMADRYPMNAPGSFVIVTVTDTGAGMDAATLEHLFEPFFTTKPSGQGIGLASVYGTVKQGNGEVRVRSEPSLGTTFELFFPRARGPAQTTTRTGTDAAAEKKGSETILVVDDEAAILRLVERNLTTAGYTVLVAASGAEALKVFATSTEEIHLVLSDVMMPGMTGVELTKRLALMRPDVRVLHMSGYPRDGAGEELTSGAFLSKPFSASELRRTVREILDAPRD